MKAKKVNVVEVALRGIDSEEDRLEHGLKVLHRERQIKGAAEKLVKAWTAYLLPYIHAAESNGLECGIMTGDLIEGVNRTIKRDLLRGMNISEARIDRATDETVFEWIKTKVIL